MHLKPLDGVRGLAILLVLSGHLWIVRLDTSLWWNKLLKSGFLGVDLFFVLSGFLITRGLLYTREKPRFFRDFYIKRALRIFPLYYAVLAVAVVFVFFIETHRAPLDGYNSLWWPLTFTTNLAISFKEGWLFQSHYFVLDHFWTLAVEMQFYLLWPLVIFFVPRKWLAPVFLFVVVLAMGSRFVADGIFGKWSHGAYMLTICRLDQFAIGSLLALWLAGDRKHEGLVTRYAPWFLGVTFIYTMYYAIYGGAHWKPVVFATFFALLMHQALTLPFARKVFSNPALVHIGKYSYAIYVFHHLLYPAAKIYIWRGLLAGFEPAVAQALYALIVLAGTYGMARLTWFAIENPALKLKSRLIG